MDRCRATFGQEPFAWIEGPDPVHALGVVSGAAHSSLSEAAERGLDGLLTGEPAEHVMADAREGGLHFLACGHYATETLGVRRLGDLLADALRRGAPLHRRAQPDLVRTRNRLQRRGERLLSVVTASTRGET